MQFSSRAAAQLARFVRVIGPFGVNTCATHVPVIIRHRHKTSIKYTFSVRQLGGVLYATPRFSAIGPPPFPWNGPARDP
jgi:hypothetical protein